MMGYNIGLYIDGVEQEGAYFNIRNGFMCLYFKGYNIYTYMTEGYFQHMFSKFNYRDDLKSIYFTYHTHDHFNNGYEDEYDDSYAGRYKIVFHEKKDYNYAKEILFAHVEKINE